MSDKIVVYFKIFGLFMAFILSGCASVIPCGSPSISGEGDFVFKNGDHYVGHYDCFDSGKGAVHGKGTMYKKDGTVVKSLGWYGYGNGDYPFPTPYHETETQLPSGFIIREQVESSGKMFVDVKIGNKSSQSGSSVLSYQVNPNGEDYWFLKINDRVATSHLGPKSIKKFKIDCGKVPIGFVMTQGQCINGSPNGIVRLDGLDGREEISLQYVDGNPVGPMQYEYFIVKKNEDQIDQFYSTHLGKISVYIDKIIIATGAPSLTSNSQGYSLDFSHLDRYAEHGDHYVRYFYNGFTTNFRLNGSGECVADFFNSDGMTRRSNSVSLEKCSYDANQYGLRSDDVYNDRLVYNRAKREEEAKEREESERESRKKWEEQQKALSDGDQLRAYNSSVAGAMSGLANSLRLSSEIQSNANKNMEDYNRRAAEEKSAKIQEQLRESERAAQNRSDTGRGQAYRSGNSTAQGASVPGISGAGAVSVTSIGNEGRGGQSSNTSGTSWNAASCGGNEKINEAISSHLEPRDHWWSTAQAWQDSRLGRCQSRREIEAQAHALAVKQVNSVTKLNGKPIALTISDEQFVCDNINLGWHCAAYIRTKLSNGQYYFPGGLVEYEK